MEVKAVTMGWGLEKVLNCWVRLMHCFTLPWMLEVTNDDGAMTDPCCRFLKVGIRRINTPICARPTGVCEGDRHQLITQEMNVVVQRRGTSTQTGQWECLGEDGR